MQVHGHINFDVTLETATTNFDALDIACLGKNKLFLDNSTTQSLHGIPDWYNGTLTLKDRRATIPAEHRRPQASHRESQSSFVGNTQETSPVPVQIVNKSYVPASSQLTNRVRRDMQQTRTTPALIEPPRMEADSVLDLHPACNDPMVARTLRTWLPGKRSATVQVANIGYHAINLPRGTVVGHSTPAASVDTT